MPRKKRLDKREIALYSYTWKDDGPDYIVSTETWSGRVSQKDKRIVQVHETAPGRGLIWTRTSLKEES